MELDVLFPCIPAPAEQHLSRTTKKSKTRADVSTKPVPVFTGSSVTVATAGAAAGLLVALLGGLPGPACAGEEGLGTSTSDVLEALHPFSPALMDSLKCSMVASV